jgi:hypothetical protein
VDGDAHITPSDVVLIVNYLNARLPSAIPSDAPIGNGGTQPFYDVDADDHVTPTDVVLVVNVLNAGQGGPINREGAGSFLAIGMSAAGEGSQPVPSQTAADFDALLALLAFDAAEQLQRRRRGL